MYSHFTGKLIEKNPTYVIIECGGVGYQLHISLNTYSKIKDSESCKLLAHQVIKEDAHTLFGFSTEEERGLFRYLISVSGVGANTARMILSSLNPEELYIAILGNNVSQLQSIKGIGTKTAQRIILELKDKLKKTDSPVQIFDSIHNSKREESLTALTMLGFSRSVAEKSLEKVLNSKGSDISIEELIKETLKLL